MVGILVLAAGVAIAEAGGNSGRGRQDRLAHLGNLDERPDRAGISYAYSGNNRARGVTNWCANRNQPGEIFVNRRGVADAFGAMDLDHELADLGDGSWRQALKRGLPQNCDDGLGAQLHQQCLSKRCGVQGEALTWRGPNDDRAFALHGQEIETPITPPHGEESVEAPFGGQSLEF